VSEEIKIIKATGEIEPFSEEKVVSSLMRAGASKELANEIVEKIKPGLYQNIPSFQIYTSVMNLLKERQNEIATKYNLKNAIMKLGPSGYPFEKFIAGVLEEHGHKTQINQIIMGKCVSHEIDIVSQNSKKHMIECKFHSLPGGRTDIKVALYTYARFLDIKEKGGFDLPWLITNTKVTKEVVSYAGCVGMKITAWDYPVGESLNELIDESNLIPITAATDLSQEQITSLIEKGIVYFKDFQKNK